VVTGIKASGGGKVKRQQRKGVSVLACLLELSVWKLPLVVEPGNFGMGDDT
jgi:hypothetical protein